MIAVRSRTHGCQAWSARVQAWYFLFTKLVGPQRRLGVRYDRFICQRSPVHLHEVSAFAQPKESLELATSDRAALPHDSLLLRRAEHPSR